MDKKPRVHHAKPDYNWVRKTQLPKLLVKGLVNAHWSMGQLAWSIRLNRSTPLRSVDWSMVKRLTVTVDQCMKVRDNLLTTLSGTCKRVSLFPMRGGACKLCDDMWRHVQSQLSAWNRIWTYFGAWQRVNTFYRCVLMHKTCFRSLEVV